MMRIRRHLPRTARRVTLAVLAILVAAWALISYWQLRPYDNVTFTPFQTDRAAYVQGDIIAMTNMFCWDGVSFTATREFQGAVTAISAGYVRFAEWPAPGVSKQVDKFRDAPDNCADSLIKIQVPQILPPGEWSVRYIVTYEPPGNPVRRVTVTNTSNAFTVTAAPTS
jgi:hypothetical protein